jgi:cephalosporin-C deacetylase-like acetyl esterase
MNTKTRCEIRSRGIGVEQYAPSTSVEVLMKRVNAIMNELPYLSNTNRIIKVAKVSLQDELMNRMVEIIALANEGYVEQAWKSLRKTCKWMAEMNMATESMIKVIVG